MRPFRAGFLRHLEPVFVVASVSLLIAQASATCWLNERRMLDATRYAAAERATVDSRASASQNGPAQDRQAVTSAGAAGRPVQPPLDRNLLTRQWAAYEEVRTKSVIELQPLRRTTSIDLAGDGRRPGTATLINLNPIINAWYVLSVTWDDGRTARYHLANARPDAQDVTLSPDYPWGLVIATSSSRTQCDLWSPASPLPLVVASTARSPYVTLCDGGVTLRLPTAGRKTEAERATDFLRDHVWNGETITGLVRKTFFRDAFLARAEPAAGMTSVVAGLDGVVPTAARIDASYGTRQVVSNDLGILTVGRVAIGHWANVEDHPGVFVSLIEPNAVAADILESDRSRVNPLDAVESHALALLVAFDLAQFDVGFSVGTDHPRVGWSDRVRPEVRAPALAGPDGIDTIAPLVGTGLVDPSVAARIEATFTGGFKRGHGAFRNGALALTHSGSHYGFIEQGVVLSKLQPGLSTFFALDDGTVGLKTWSESDNNMVGRVKFARQNGVSLVEPNAAGVTVPGAFVARWAEGNWSGSEEGRLRTLRAGLCLQEGEGRRFLIYGYFSSATPSAMARVFQAYQCSYAMHLDMNALEHTYLAVYGVRDGQLTVQHLIKGMSVLDKPGSNGVLPRFVGMADNRDFFYLLRRSHGEAQP